MKKLISILLLFALTNSNNVNAQTGKPKNPIPVKNAASTDSVTYVIIKLTLDEFYEFQLILNKSSAPHDVWQQFVNDIQKPGKITNTTEKKQ